MPAHPTHPEHSLSDYSTATVAFTARKPIPSRYSFVDTYVTSIFLIFFPTLLDLTSACYTVKRITGFLGCPWNFPVLRLDKNILVTGTSFPFPKAFFSTLQSGKMSHSRGWDIFHSWEGKGKKTTTLPGLSGK